MIAAIDNHRFILRITGSIGVGTAIGMGAFVFAAWMLPHTVIGVVATNYIAFPILGSALGVGFIGVCLLGVTIPRKRKHTKKSPSEVKEVPKSTFARSEETTLYKNTINKNNRDATGYEAFHEAQTVSYFDENLFLIVNAATSLRVFEPDGNLKFCRPSAPDKKKRLVMLLASTDEAYAQLNRDFHSIVQRVEVDMGIIKNGGMIMLVPTQIRQKMRHGNVKPISKIIQTGNLPLGSSSELNSNNEEFSYILCQKYRAGYIAYRHPEEIITPSN